MPHRTKDQGFTLVELLVVIAVIGTLMAFLMPALGRARFLAQEQVCLAKARQQFLVQCAYATDAKGQFPVHRDVWPMYYRMSGINFPGNYNVWDVLNKQYLTDGKLMVCPIQSVYGGIYANPSYVEPTAPTFGGWKSGVANISSGYEWFANWYFYTPTFLNGEPAWPKTLSDTNSRAVVVAHQIYENATPGWDMSHGSTVRRFMSNTLPTSTSNPVVYADMHAEIHTGENYIKRVNAGGSIFWY